MEKVTDDVVAEIRKRHETMRGFVTAVPSVNDALLDRATLLRLHEQDQEEIGRLREALNTPEVEDFVKGVVSEAQHQRERWGADHDKGKAPLDWFWLIGYLSQKAATSAMNGDVEKAMHHTISTSAALANWHAALSGHHTRMVPGAPLPVEAEGEDRAAIKDHSHD